MSKLLKVFLFVFVVGIPALCYLFLDQLYVRRFVDFSNKWLARESPLIIAKGENLPELLKPYEEVAQVADDLIGFGIVRNEEPTFKGPDVVLERTGFLQFRTLVRIEAAPDKLVFFTFRDDMAYFNFAILALACLSGIGITLLARARLARQKEKTFQETTVLAIQSLAHDFRAPFGKLRIFMTQLKEVDPAGYEKLRAMSDALDTSVEHADDILTDFLSLDAKPALTATDCEVIVRRLETKFFAQWRIEYPQIELSFDHPKDLFVLAHERKTLRILFNLLDNALKHATSYVKLSIEPNDGEIVFSVTNDGPQIDQRQLKHLFKPFFSRRKGGLGLGLFICDSFVKMQGGKLVCASTPEITEFSFSLKVAQAQKIAVKQKPAAATSHYTIAYIDDEQFYLDALKVALQSSGIAVTTYSHTDEFLMELKAGKTAFDLILVDRFGPHFDAVKDRFDESCRDYGYKGPIVLYSNSVANEAELKGFKRAIDKMRPLTAEIIIDIIEETRNGTF